MRAVRHFPIRHPWIALALLALVTAVDAPHLADLRLDSRTDNILSPENPRVATYREFRETYGTDEILVLGFREPEGRTVLEGDAFGVLDELTRRIEELDRVEKVISLSNVRVPAAVPAGPGGGVGLAPLIDRPLAEGEAAAAERAERVRSLPLFFGQLVSEDLRTAACLATLTPADRPEEVQTHQIRAVESARAILDELSEETGRSFHMAGTPATKTAFVSLLGRDLAVFIPVSLVLISIVLLLLFRSARGLLLPLATVALATTWTMGIMAWAGGSLNTVTSLLPPLLLAVGIGDVIHLLTAWLDLREAHPDDPRVAIEEAVDETAGPILLTTVTTAAGFLSLTISPIGPIREFGIFAAVGVTSAFILSVTLVPALLSLSPGRPGSAEDGGVEPSDRPGFCGHEGNGWFAGASETLATVVVDRPWSTLAGTLVLCGLLGASTFAWLEVEVDFLSYFKEDSRHARDFAFFTENLSGPAPLELVVRGPAGAFANREEHRRLATFQERLEELTLPDRHGRTIDPIDTTVSVADFAMAASAVSGGEYAVPSDERLRRFGLLARLARGGQGLDRLLREDLSAARISGRMKNIGSRESAALVDRVREVFAEVYPEGERELVVTGGAVIFLEASETITRNQLQSFGLALAFVFGAILFLFRSPRIAVISLVPNVFPIGVMFGTMALLGFTLNMSTAMVASIAIGIAVDDTIHFFSSYGRELRREGDDRTAILRTARRVGAACATSSVILCAGFGVSIFASFHPTINFGILSAIAIAAAYVGDFIVLPAILTVWDSGGGGDGGS